MKRTLLLFLLFGALTSSSLYAQFQEKNIIIDFTDSMTPEKLDAIQKNLFDQDINLEYENVVFNETGKLLELSFKVQIKDLYKGSASTKRLWLHENFGFFYIPGHKVPFGTGNINEQVKKYKKP